MEIELVSHLNDFSYGGIGTVIDLRERLTSKNYEVLYLGAAAAYAQLAYRLGRITRAEEQELLLSIQVILEGM